MCALLKADLHHLGLSLQGVKVGYSDIILCGALLMASMLVQ